MHTPLTLFVAIHTAIICMVGASYLNTVAENVTDTATMLTSSKDVINPHNFVYLINNPLLCHQDSESVELLVWVHSAPEHTRIRTVVRETWASLLPTYIGKVKVVFFLGAVNNELLQSRLYYENEVYRDIVQETYIDSYRNNTYKGMSALKWITRFCNDTDLVLKTDDDAMVDVHTLFVQLDRRLNYPLEPLGDSTIICDVNRNVPAVRDGVYKWSVTEEEYSRDVYPPFCPGLAFLLSPDLIPAMWELSLRTKFFWVDDIFLTGLLIEQMQTDIRWVQLGYYYDYKNSNIFIPGFLKRWFKSNIIFAHISPYSYEMAYYLWENRN